MPTAYDGNSCGKKFRKINFTIFCFSSLHNSETGKEIFAQCATIYFKKVEIIVAEAC
jgi:hypothetical protein